MTKKDRIQDDGQVGKYFTLLYNMADDDLNPYQYRLLGHYKRVCGETGKCYESTRTTSRKCKMSTGKVAGTRRELQTMGYIAIDDSKGDETLSITVVDRMIENVNRYAKRSPDEQGVHEVNESVHEVKQRITLEEEPLKNLSSAVANGKKPRPINKNAPTHDALLECFGLTPETVTKTGDKTYWTATADFAKIGFPVEKIVPFYRWCKAQNWNSFSVMAMAKYAGEWLSKQPNTPVELGDDGEPVTAAYTIGSDDDPFKDEIID